MKHCLFTLAFIAAVTFNGSAQRLTQSNNKFEFTKLTFYSSPCFGTCPKIAMNIYSNKVIEVSVQYYQGKGRTDTTNSGNYKDTLNEAAYKELISLLQKQDWDTMVFPEEFCCDAPVRTIILSYNGKHRQFSSMFPPESAREIIKYLATLATDGSLKRYDGELQFEPVARK